MCSLLLTIPQAKFKYAIPFRKWVHIVSIGSSGRIVSIFVVVGIATSKLEFRLQSETYELWMTSTCMVETNLLIPIGYLTLSRTGTPYSLHILVMA